MSNPQQSEVWSSRLGVILAVAGSAVGLGNFLRFPGLAAQYGSGAFMIAYFISLLIIGVPICWAEWTLGRYAGLKGFRSSPGIFNALVRHPVGKYIGVLGVVIPVVIYMYYVYIETWCLGYAWYFLTGKLNLGGDVQAYSDFWSNLVGMGSDGAVFQKTSGIGIFLLIVFALNFFLIYRGLAKGIEIFCTYAMPTLIILALIVLVRVLTLGTPDPAKPDQNIVNGLGYMWSPTKVIVEKLDAGKWTHETELSNPKLIDAKRREIAGDPNRRMIDQSVLKGLKNPQLWLAAAGQIFFSLSVGFGVIVTYASYLKNKDDVVLSGLTATSTNEFCEVGLGGMITVPAAFMFLGAAGIVGQGTFGLGFNVLPLVFAKMPFPAFFGFAWFFLLFLAAVTSSLSMLQPGIAFIEEALRLTRKQSVTLLSVMTALGCLFVVYFSKDLKALNTIDFWAGTLLIFIMATVLIIVFGWVVGIEKGWEEAHRGSEMRIPTVFKFIMKYLSPLYLVGIFVLWLLFNVFGWDPSSGELKPTGYVLDLVGEKPSSVARMSVALVAIVSVCFLLITASAGKRWNRELAEAEKKQ